MKPIKDPIKLTPYKCRHTFEPMCEDECMSGTKHKLPNITKMRNPVTNKRVAPKTMSLARELASNQFVIGSGRRKHALQHTYPTRNPQINAAIVDVAIIDQDHCGSAFMCAGLCPNPPTFVVVMNSPATKHLPVLSWRESSSSSRKIGASLQRVLQILGVSGKYDCFAVETILSVIPNCLLYSKGKSSFFRTFQGWLLLITISKSQRLVRPY